MQALFATWDRELPRISGESKLAEAIRYIANPWPNSDIDALTPWTFKPLA